MSCTYAKGFLAANDIETCNDTRERERKKIIFERNEREKTLKGSTARKTKILIVHCIECLFRCHFVGEKSET